jgi:hypothetical protein
MVPPGRLLAFLPSAVPSLYNFLAKSLFVRLFVCVPEGRDLFSFGVSVFRSFEVPSRVLKTI